MTFLRPVQAAKNPTARRRGPRRPPARVSRRWPAAATCAAVVAGLTALAGCVDDTGGATTGGVGTSVPRALLVVGTDYASTSLSWVDPAQTALTAGAFLHSGTVVSASGAALSGDVVPGSSGFADGRFPVVDRSHSTLTWVGGAPGSAPQQWSLSDGFVANPQDAHVAGPDLVAVVRAQADPTPTDHPKSGGDDVLLLNAAGEVQGRVALTAQSTLPGGTAFAGRGARHHSTLWLPLGSFATDFSAAGVGRVVGVDLGQRSVTAHADLPGLRNCTWLDHTAAEVKRGDAPLLVGTCSGLFQGSEADQRAGSGVFNVRLTAQGPVASTVVRGADWTEGGAVAFPVAQDATRRGWFVRFGRLGDAPRPDAVWTYAPGSGTPPAKVYAGGGAFELGGLWLDRATQRLWVADAGSADGDLVVLDVSGDIAKEVARVKTDTVGLRAVHLAARVAP